MSDSKTLVFFLRPSPGFAYTPGEIGPVDRRQTQMLYASGAIRPCSEDEIKEYNARLADEAAQRVVVNDFEELCIKYDALLVQNLTMKAELDALRAVAGTPVQNPVSISVPPPADSHKDGDKKK